MRRPSRWGRAMGAVALTVAVAGPLALASPARAATAVPAVFRVGAGTAPVDPTAATGPTHVGGYGDCRGCTVDDGGTAKVRAGDSLDVRALYVAAPDGYAADVIVTVPAEGMFAANDEAADVGIDPLRAQIAAALSAPGAPVVTVPRVLVSTVHCHACPTLVGIWGPTNVSYLRYVQSQAVTAAVTARDSAVPATLRRATADIAYTDDVTVGQLNANEGWPLDGQLSVLQARATGDRHPIATYAAVPVHGNITKGPELDEMTSEHFGAAQRWLQAHGQGVGIVAAGTLGDQTSPMQGDSVRLPDDPRVPHDAQGHPLDVGGQPGYPRAYDDIDRLGALTGSTAVEALDRHGVDITDGHLDGREQRVPVPVTNPVVLGLLYEHTIDSQLGTPAVQSLTGVAPADRSNQPPYAVGNTVGVTFTVLRIGDVAVVSEPGEAFPHISIALMQAISGAGAVFPIGNAQDQLGYYYDPFAYPSTLYYSADHYTFNVGPTLGEQNVQTSTALAALLGFTVTPTVATPLGNDYTRYVLDGGVQTFVYPQGPADPVGATDPAVAQSSIRLAIELRASDARGNDYDAALPTGPLGEQSTAAPSVSVDGSPAPLDPALGMHVFTFPGPGDYTVRATLPGTQETWLACAHVRSATDVTNTASYPAATGPHPLALQNLHDGSGDGCAAAFGSPPGATLPETPYPAVLLALAAVIAVLLVRRARAV